MSATIEAGHRTAAGRRAVGWASAAPLTARGTRRGIRGGEAVVAIGLPILFFLCLYAPIHNAVPDYAQFLLPVVLVQSCLFSAILAAANAGTDIRGAISDRFLSLPIPRTAPAVARLAGVVIRTVLSMAAALAIAAAFGFRFHGDAGELLLFLAVPLVLTAALSMLTDALGQVLADPDAASQVLVVPQLVLTMLSTGIVPSSGFPDWIRPFVDHQPVTVYVELLRSLAAGDGIDRGIAAACWTAGLVLCGVLALRAAGRREARR